MHFVQSVFCTSFPSSSTLTFCKLGLNLRRVAFIEKLRLLPNLVVLPQFSQCAIGRVTFLRNYFQLLNGHNRTTTCLRSEKRASPERTTYEHR